MHKSSPSVHSHPGYLYQFTRTGGGDISSIIKTAATGINAKEQTLHVYLTPSASFTTTNPFNNRRLKSLVDDVDVIVFDSPPEKETGPIYFSKMLQQYYSAETLMKINAALTTSLKNRNIDMSELDQVAEKDPEKMAPAIVAKVFLLMGTSVGMGQKSSEPSAPSCSSAPHPSSSSSSGPAHDPVSPTEELNPKERIHRTAEELGKTIEYIHETSFVERNKELLFDKGLLEMILCSFITDQELVQEMASITENEGDNWNAGAVKTDSDNRLENHPTILDIKQRWTDGDIDRTFALNDLDTTLTLAQKINTYLSSKKKTLFVLEESPKIIEEIQRFAPLLNDNHAEINVKGPIKEPTGYFWKIKKNETTVGYLLGSIHLTPNHLLYLNSRIRKCFDKSARLAVEIDVTSPESKKIKFLELKKQWEEKYRTYTAEQADNIFNTLKKIFPEEAEQVDTTNDEEKSTFILGQISKLTSKINTDLELFSGIDFQLIEQAKASGKPVEDLETREQYAQQEVTQEKLARDPIRDLFLNALAMEEVRNIDNPSEIIDLLIEYVSSYRREVLQPLFDAWEEGNREHFDTSKTDSTEEKMWMTQRNMNMAMKVVSLVGTLANDGEKLFCCVGAAHIDGEMSVQAFLKNFGFSTERVFV